MKRKFAYAAIVVLVAVAGGCGGGTVGSGSGGGNPPPPPPPPAATITSFTATPSTVNAGGQVTLAWKSDNATSCTGSATPAQGDWSGSEPTSSEGVLVTPSPVGTVMYAITCTGSGGTSKPSSAVVTVNAVPIVVTISPTSASVVASKTQQFTATVTGTTNTAVTWSSAPTTAGSVSVTGLFTAAPVSSPTKATVTVTSQADKTKSASASVAITVAPIVISRSDIPGIFDRAHRATVCCVQLFGSGFTPDVTVSSNPNLQAYVNGVVNSGQVSIGFNLLDPTYYDPGPVSLTVSNASQNSNPFTVVFFGGYNTLATAGGNAFLEDNPTTGTVTHLFTLANGSANGSISFASPWAGMATDDTLDYVLFGQWTNFVPAFNVSGGTPSGLTTGFVSVGAAAKDGTGCASEPANGVLDCGDLSQFIPPITTVPAGKEPWASVMGDGCEAPGVTGVYAYDDQDLQSFHYSSQVVGGTVNMALESSTSIPGTPALTFLDAFPMLGMWDVVDSNAQCAQAIFAPVLESDGSAAQQVVLVVGTVPTITAVTAPNNSFRIALDDVHGAVIVAYDDPVAALTRFVSVSIATADVTQLTTTSTVRGGGLKVSADGQSIYYGVRDQFSILPNQ